MNRYKTMTRHIRDVLTPSYSDDILLTILTKSRATRDLQIGLQDNDACIHNDLEHYNNRYDIMNNDTYRNEFFEKAIASLSTTHHKWFEIGPGADGCLTKMVLKAHHLNKVNAVEGSESAYTKLTKRMARFIRSGRLTLVNGIAGKVAIGGEYDVLLAEILGHWASSEGYAEILRQSGILYGEFKETIPSVFGTMMVPVDLSQAHRLIPTMVGAKLVLFRKFPFDETRLAENDKAFEFYSGKDLLRRGENRAPVVTEISWIVNKKGCFQGFSTYLVYGSHLQELYNSIYSKENHTSNWNHCFIPSGPVEVLPQYLITCKCTCSVFQWEPSYRFEVRIYNESNTMIFDQSIDIHYGDLYAYIVKFQDI